MRIISMWPKLDIPFMWERIGVHSTYGHAATIGAATIEEILYEYGYTFKNLINLDIATSPSLA